MTEGIKTYAELPKILIVDDKPANILSLESILEDLDLICVSALSGKEALGLVKHHNFALILMDIQMPGMDGFETIRLLKANEKTKNIPIIFNTAYDRDVHHVNKGYEAGAADYIFKPIQPEILKGKVKIFLDIYNKEKALIESKNYAESIIRNFIDILIVVDNEARIKSANEATCRLLGYKDKELLGKPVDIIFEKNDKEKATRLFNFQCEDIAKDNFQDDDCHRNQELYCLTKGGQTIAMYFNVAKYTDDKGNITGAVAGARNIRELKQSEEKIKNEKIICEKIVKNIQEGIIVVGTDGVIEFVNDGITKMLGRSKDELIGEVFGFPIIEDESTEIDILGKGGCIGVGEIRSSGIEWAGKEAAFITVLDITELKRTEEKLRQLSNELQDRNTDLKSYAHTVAHDLKGPVGNIKNFAELIYSEYEEHSKEEIKKFLGIISKSSHSLIGIINELLLFASLQKTEITTAELDMKEIVNRALQSLVHMKQKENHEVILPEKFIPSIGHAPWVEEVWKNYISNSYKYAGEGSTIEIGSDLINNAVKYWIKDNGPGISKKNQSLLFNKFERLENAKATGHGLGLSIVRRIIEKLGGRVGVESELGKGSCFYFTLPCTPSSEDNRSASAETSSKDEGDLQNLKTLIVEDDMASDIYIDIVAKKFSNNILHVKSGSDAIKTCQENPDIDLILMDVGLPDINGLEATKKIRAFNGKVIIIAQTAFTLTSDRKQAIEAGCNDYISKPINVEELLEMVRNHLPPKSH